MGEVSYRREDWTLFRSPATLPQRTGVAPELLRRLVIKELVDNALDAADGAAVGFGEIKGGYFVEDGGPGIEPEALAEMFSIARPLVSSKTVRLPTRGALGNGLRVVSGAVVASGGSLVVETRRRRVTLVPHDDGTTTAASAVGRRTSGTCIEVVIGAAIPADPHGDPFAWAALAKYLAEPGNGYRGKSSAWWYGEDDFFELLQAAQDRSVRDLVGMLDGCSGAKAGRVAAPYLGRAAPSLSRAEAAGLLLRARTSSKEVRPARLGAVGPLAKFPCRVARSGVFEVPGGRGAPARIPYVLEAWARPSPSGEDELTVCVNRTPITAQVDTQRQSQARATLFCVFGCGIENGVALTRTTPPLSILVNITTPYMPLTHEGKAPRLTVVEDDLLDALAVVARKAKRRVPSGAIERNSQKNLILAALPAAIEQASGGGAHRYTPRQAWYAAHPFLVQALGAEPSYSYFTQVLTAREREAGPLPGIYRDPRGTLYLPHSGQEIALGTLAVEEYRHPAWTFNKVLYIEKEGFFEILKAAGWPERHDCALLTSKGQPTGAARDLFDLLGEVGEEIRFFCVHDADGYGTTIFHALVHETRARAARRVRIINLGLEPTEAVAMGLPVEPVIREAGARRVAVAPYVPAKWRTWLQTHRVELNAMTSPQFLAWLDAKMAAHGQGRLVPPARVLRERLASETVARVRQRLTDEILKTANIDGQVVAETRRLRGRLVAKAKTLGTAIRRGLARMPTQSWKNFADEVAVDLASDARARRPSPVPPARRSTPRRRSP